ncbi:MAG: hypothetical protein JRI96_14570, partial [Deltaproteobacteria bacterium]|nr:hypothetical protein [Deltaproteobacteria bacterium]
SNTAGILGGLILAAFVCVVTTLVFSLPKLIRNFKSGQFLSFSFRQYRGIIDGLGDASGHFLYYDRELSGWTVVAGSPHFDQREGGYYCNWGRDTMISLPGLCLETGRLDIFRAVMRNYLRFVEGGILPNYLGNGQCPSYNSIDAAMWMFWAMSEYLRYTKDFAFLETPIERVAREGKLTTIRETLEEIVNAFRAGIGYKHKWEWDGQRQSQWIDIRVDSDFLIKAGSPDTQLTWMDARPRWQGPISSRHGKPVEINALWYRALLVMHDIYNHRREMSKAAEYGELARGVKKSFSKFWNEEEQCLYDVIDADPRQGSMVRPNQVFAVSSGLLDREKALLVMDKVRRELLTPYGLRTLSPKDEWYCRQHHNEWTYHQGTVWPWLMGAFIEASIFVYGRAGTIRILQDIRDIENRNYFDVLSFLLRKHSSIPEIFNGECISADHYNRVGCPAQAWSVAEPLRGLSLLFAKGTSQRVVSEAKEAQGNRIIYEMVIRDYYDAQDKIPGLRVASEELPYLAEAGVEYIYLVGLVKHAGDPFAIVEPFDIDERAGDFEDLGRFIDAAHRLGMKVIDDWLANQHLVKESPICNRSPERFLYTNASDGNFFSEEQGTQIYRGQDLPVGELRRRIDTGRKLIEKLKNKDLPPDGVIQIGARSIPYRKANEELRKKCRIEGGFPPFIVSGQEALFLVSATDAVSLEKFPRRWVGSAQPDLSHPEVRRQALKVGRFWLKKGLDGFRIDAALSTFPDIARKNWELEVEDNLTGLFIEKMRKIKPQCFILFEGFERAEELMRLADSRNCAVYFWPTRDWGTYTLRYFDNPRNLEQLTFTLKRLQQKLIEVGGNFISFGPEHDAFNYDDPWTKLDYKERLWLYFMYMFLPGPALVFNGQIYGRQHYYKQEMEESQPAPRVTDADERQLQVGRRLFTLREEYPQLVKGEYQFLESDKDGVFGLARFDENEIIIGVLNATSSCQSVKFNIQAILELQGVPSDRSLTIYQQESLFLSEDSGVWEERKRPSITARALLEEGLFAESGAKSFKLIRLSREFSDNQVFSEKTELGQTENQGEATSSVAGGSSLPVPSISRWTMDDNFRSLGRIKSGLPLRGWSGAGLFPAASLVKQLTLAATEGSPEYPLRMTEGNPACGERSRTKYSLAFWHAGVANGASRPAALTKSYALYPTPDKGLDSDERLIVQLIAQALRKKAGEVAIAEVKVDYSDRMLYPRHDTLRFDALPLPGGKAAMIARINPCCLKVLASAFARNPAIVRKIIFGLFPDHETRSFHKMPFVTGNLEYADDLDLARRKFIELGLDNIEGVELEDLTFKGRPLYSQEKNRSPPWIEVVAWITTGKTRTERAENLALWMFYGSVLVDGIEDEALLRRAIKHRIENNIIYFWVKSGKFTSLREIEEKAVQLFAEYKQVKRISKSVEIHGNLSKSIVRKFRWAIAGKVPLSITNYTPGVCIGSRWATMGKAFRYIIRATIPERTPRKRPIRIPRRVPRKHPERKPAEPERKPQRKPQREPLPVGLNHGMRAEQIDLKKSLRIASLLCEFRISIREEDGHRIERASRKLWKTGLPELKKVVSDAYLAAAKEGKPDIAESIVDGAAGRYYSKVAGILANTLDELLKEDSFLDYQKQVRVIVAHLKDCEDAADEVAPTLGRALIRCIEEEDADTAKQILSALVEIDPDMTPRVDDWYLYIPLMCAKQISRLIRFFRTIRLWNMPIQAVPPAKPDEIVIAIGNGLKKLADTDHYWQDFIELCVDALGSKEKQLVHIVPQLTHFLEWAHSNNRFESASKIAAVIEKAGPRAQEAVGILDKLLSKTIDCEWRGSGYLDYYKYRTFIYALEKIGTEEAVYSLKNNLVLAARKASYEYIDSLGFALARVNPEIGPSALAEELTKEADKSNWQTVNNLVYAIGHFIERKGAGPAVCELSNVRKKAASAKKWETVKLIDSQFARIGFFQPVDFLNRITREPLSEWISLGAKLFPGSSAKAIFNPTIHPDELARKIKRKLVEHFGTQDETEDEDEEEDEHEEEAGYLSRLSIRIKMLLLAIATILISAAVYQAVCFVIAHIKLFINLLIMAAVSAVGVLGLFLPTMWSSSLPPRASSDLQISVG